MERNCFNFKRKQKKTPVTIHPVFHYPKCSSELMKTQGYSTRAQV